MRKSVVFVLLFLLVSGFFIVPVSFVLAPYAPGDYWNTKTPMSQERAGAGVVAVDGKIYAIGSSGNGVVERYDPVTDKWVALEHRPSSTSFYSVVACQDKIYCISQNVTEVYDVSTNSWSVKASIPDHVGAFLQAQIVNDKIFVMTRQVADLVKDVEFTAYYGWVKDTMGHIYSCCIARLYMYDPANDVWTEKAAVPYPVPSDVSFISYSVLVVANNKLMVLGKFFTENSLALENNQMGCKVLVYDLKCDVWTEKELPMPDGLRFHDAVGVTSGRYAPQRIYFFYPLQTFVYNPARNSWSTTTPIPTGSGSYSVAVIDDIFYVIGDKHIPTGGTDEERRISWSGMGYEAVNSQYIPKGYSDSLTSPATLLHYLLIVALSLTAGLIVVGLVYVIFQKKVALKK